MLKVMNIKPNMYMFHKNRGRFPWKIFSTWKGFLKARNSLTQQSDACICTLYGQRWEHSNHCLYRPLKFSHTTYICSVQHRNHYSHIAIEHVKCGQSQRSCVLNIKYTLNFKTLGYRETKKRMWNISFSFLKYWVHIEMTVFISLFK